MQAETTFGQWLKQRRKALHLAQKELADRAQCAPVTILKIEAGERRPSSQVARALAAALGVPADEYPAFVEFARSAGAPGSAPLDAAPDPAPWRARQPPAGQLLCPPTSFVGREAVLAAAREALLRPGARLLTFTGPPGVGKTRTAVQVAAEASSEFPDGTLFVALGGLTDPSRVLPTLAGALGVAESGAAPLFDRLARQVRDGRRLLVLDHFDPVAAAAPTVTALLSAAPWLRVLVTSRAPLYLYGEVTLPLAPLPVPPPATDHLPGLKQLLSYEAARLFVDRARAVQPAFALDPANTLALIALCARLGGNPLALELVAARTRTLPLPTIRAQLEPWLEPSVTGAGDLPDGAEVLRGVLGWTCALLPPAERRLLQRLSANGQEGLSEILAAPGVPEDAGEPGGAGDLAALADHGLLQAGGAGGATRYRLPEIIRELVRAQARALGG